MKIESISGQNIEPIANVEISGMESVVIIAGANGSGKTRMKQAIVQTFLNPLGPQVGLTIRATRPEEESQWGGATLRISPSEANATFAQYMGRTTIGRTYTGTIIQVDSQRTLQPLQFRQMFLSTPDPDDQIIDYRYYLNPSSGRWNETINRIYEKIANRDYKIAQYVKENPAGTSAEALDRHPDPFVPFQELFAKLLPGKSLEPLDPKVQREFFYRTPTMQSLPFSSLSSGEQEVVKVTFDLLLKQISHCVFLIDEPELHLHPTLTFRLVETLKEMGGGTNQFIFFTHSADLISTYYSTGNVYFIDSERTGANQAHRLSDLDTTHAGLVRAMGENLGLFAVGKKLVFVEGRQSSRDRLTYHAIAQEYFAEARIIPAESSDNVMGLNRFAEELHQSIFGIDFFMIRDRDGLTGSAVADVERSGRLRCLPKHHLENYFLDAEVLASVAQRFCVADGAYHDSAHVKAILLAIAQASVGEALSLNIKEYLRVNRSFEIPTVRNVGSKSLDDLENEFLQGTADSLSRYAQRFEDTTLRNAFAEERRRVEDAVAGGGWKDVFPGKLIFERYCGSGYLRTDDVRVRQAYTEIALAEKPAVFQDIAGIFRSFQAGAV